MIPTLSTNVAEMRRAALSSLIEVTESSVGSFYQLYQNGEVLDAVFHSTSGVDVATVRTRFAQQQKALVPAVAASYRRTWGAESFLNAAQCYGTGEAYERHPIVVGVFQQFGYIDQLRIALFDGPRHVAWFGVLRVRGEKPFTAEHMRAANRLHASTTTTLLTADRMVRAAIPEEGCDLLVKPSGNIEFASAVGKAWLKHPTSRPLVRALVEAGEGRPGDETILLEAGLWARVARLESNGRVRYLVQIRSAAAYRLRPLSGITPAQRDVGLLLARGCTVGEAARHLGRSHDTVKAHLRALYGRLGIASRAELARAFSDEMD